MRERDLLRRLVVDEATGEAFLNPEPEPYTRKRKRVDKAEVFAGLWRQHAEDMPEPVREFRFHPTRRWRFDFAFVDERVAVEIDGGQWKPGGGRHNTDGDREKCNEAAVAGWRLLRFSTRTLERDPLGCVAVVKRALRKG